MVNSIVRASFSDDFNEQYSDDDIAQMYEAFYKAVEAYRMSLPENERPIKLNITPGEEGLLNPYLAIEAFKSSRDQIFNSPLSPDEIDEANKLHRIEKIKELKAKVEALDFNVGGIFDFEFSYAQRVFIQMLHRATTYPGQTTDKELRASLYPASCLLVFKKDFSKMNETQRKFRNFVCDVEHITMADRDFSAEAEYAKNKS